MLPGGIVLAGGTAEVVVTGAVVTEVVGEGMGAADVSMVVVGGPEVGADVHANKPASATTPSIGTAGRKD